ncbi:DUF4145 domain-containing protein [Mesoplasma seiffertii]|uniref:DUF4145 domain-containing protein n=1 Tax=Mesoplasma seiffertii TaxID=28224 RepID=UPI00047C117B|nr:DUF4145 domain-containing protein [Mesoplasma seiffertii]
MASSKVWKAEVKENYAIDNHTYMCGKCNVMFSLQSGIDYIYFGGNQYDDDFFKEQTFLHNSLDLWDYTFYEGDYILWKCNFCRNINKNAALISSPASIVPTDKDFLEIKEYDKISEESLKKIIKEFYITRGLHLNSSATMLARKILMHIAVEQNLCQEGRKFIQYVEAIKESDLVGRNWKEKIDLIRKLGNEENHEVKVATDEELTNISNVLKNLLTNIYTD